MTANSDPEITTEETFRQALVDIVRAAHANGVEVCGGYEIESVDGDTSGYDVSITAFSR